MSDLIFLAIKDRHFLLDSREKGKRIERYLPRIFFISRDKTDLSCWRARLSRCFVWRQVSSAQSCWKMHSWTFPDRSCGFCIYHVHSQMSICVSVSSVNLVFCIYCFFPFLGVGIFSHLSFFKRSLRAYVRATSGFVPLGCCARGRGSSVWSGETNVYIRLWENIN